MTSSRIRLAALAAAVATLGACAVVPTGPSVMALQGSGKSFDQFRYDDANCRQWAQGQIGGASYETAATDSAVRSAALGTALGAVAGAALGGNSRSAGVGAGAGLLMGSAAGASAGQASGYTAQRRYDHAYLQCMYGYGHRVPVSGQFTGGPVNAPGYTPSSAPSYPQAPAAGYPPPPPPPPATPPAR